MAQTFARQNSTPQRFTAENLALSVPLTGNTTLLDLVVEGAEKLSVQVDNTVQALDAFIVQGRVHRDSSYETFASVAADYSSPTGRMLRVTGAPVTLAASASASFDMDVSGLYSVKVLASGSNATDSVVSIYASGGSAAGTPPANINASFDGEIGAVELKNAATDDRALVAASGATPTFGVAVLPVVATAAAPTIAEGKASYVSANLAGQTRVVAESGSVKSGAVASGAFASGSIASGAVAAGAVAAGALVDGADLTQGVTTGAAVITDANGTVQQYLRGLVKRWVDALGGGTEAAALRVTVASDSTGLLSVDDNGASLTVDNPILSVVGGGLEATAQRVTIASDSTGVLSVDDNGGSLTVDGAVTADTELTTADLDTGVGTDTRAVVGIVIAESGGGQLVGSANPMPVSDNAGSLTVDNTVLSVTGGGTEATAQRVTIASDSTGVLSVDDNGGSLTVDNAQLSVVGSGTEATALRVTIATDSTGVLSVDDNGGAITVDWAGTAPPIGAGLEATALRVTLATDSTGLVSVDDNSGSLTVDNAQLSVVGSGTEATAMRVTIATDSTGVLSVDDNGGSITVDNPALSVVGAGAAATAQRVHLADESLSALESITVVMSGAVDTELTTADLDTGAGTDTRAVVGLVLAESGGGTLVGSANPMPVSDNAGSLTVDNAALSVVGGGTEAGAQRVTIASDSTGVLSVDDNGGALTVDWAGTAPPIGAGLEATALRVTIATDSTGVLSVDDNSGSLTVDNAALSVTGGGVEAGTLRVTLASDSTGLVSVDDNGGSLTVDGTVSISGAVDTELTTADLDTGAGTDTRAVVGLVLAASGGGALVGSANPMPVSDNAGALTVDWAGVAPPIGAGTEAAALRVTVATDSTGVLSVDDNGASLTVDNAQLSVVGTGTEAAALRVTIATDSTGVLSVDDNGGSLTVDGTVSLTDISAGEYETVAASQTAQVLGPTGATGDYISGLLVVPATTSPGNVLLLDNATSITVFVGGATSVSNLVPFLIPLGIKSVSGAWKVTTGANVSVIGMGNFS